MIVLIKHPQSELNLINLMHKKYIQKSNNFQGLYVTLFLVEDGEIRLEKFKCLGVDFLAFAEIFKFAFLATVSKCSFRLFSCFFPSFANSSSRLDIFGVFGGTSRLPAVI